MTIPFHTKAYSMSPEKGRYLQSLGAWVSLKATSEQTGAAFNLFEVTCPVGFATSLHIHYSEHVALYVLEGTLGVVWGSSEQEAAAGSWFFQPQGTPHGFRVRSAAPARLLYMTIPAGFDRFVAEQAQASLGDQWEFSAARFKIEILGSLSE